MDKKEEIKHLKLKIKNTVGWSDSEIEAFWSNPCPLFNGKIPNEMVDNDKDWRQLRLLLKFSTLPLNLKNVYNRGDDVYNGAWATSR